MLHTRRQSAQAVVELAIALPVLLWFSLGTLDFGRVFYTYIGLTNSAREGARRATLLASPLTPTSCDSTVLSSVRATVRAEQLGLFPVAVPDSVITLECAFSNRRTVAIVDYPFQTVTPFVGQALSGDGTDIIRLSTRATLPVVNQ
jgi:hypothetical protein